VVGLVVGWDWYGQSTPKRTTTISQSVFLPPRSVSSQIKEVEQITYPSARKKNNPHTAVKVRSANKAEVEIVSIQQTVQPTTQEPVSLTPVAEIQKPTVVTTPKRRFRVVHENELMAEDEAHRVRYTPEGRTERFVRIGTGSQAHTIANEDLPALQLPLNRKITQ
ncbi:MAG: hypothetical protein LH609_18700, partial [Rudanella sp.]|nr:hypothetical protein [Rudanella sp.]